MNVVGPVTKALARPEARWVVAANVIPVAGVIFFGWHALSLVVFYWVENVVIGVFNAVKILISGVTKDTPQRVLGVVLVPFFLFHYGMFCFVHGVFVFAIFMITASFRDGLSTEVDPFDLPARVGELLAADADLMWAVAAMAVVQAGAFAIFWLGQGKWRDTDPSRQMIEPYGRIVVMHMTIIFAMLPVLALGEPMIAVLILALLKSGLELGLPVLSVASPDLSAYRRK